jgi:hypothetical protein
VGGLGRLFGSRSVSDWTLDVGDGHIGEICLQTGGPKFGLLRKKQCRRRGGKSEIIKNGLRYFKYAFPEPCNAFIVRMMDV